MKKKYVYIALISPRGSKKTGVIDTYLGGVYKSFKNAKKRLINNFNGTVKILYSNEESIEKIGLNFAYYDISLTNINGICYYYLRIEKKEVKE